MTNTAGGDVKQAEIGPVVVLTLSYPERRNAFSLQVRERLHERLIAAHANAACRAIVITGEGQHFCSGGDISSFEGITTVAGRARIQRLQPIVRLIVRGEKPVVAAVEGHAAGAGLCIASACDIVVASREAKFSCTFNKIGLMADFGGAYTIPARMGLGRAKMLMMSGRQIDAETAERYGLVDQLSAPGAALNDAIALAQDIAKTAPLSIAATKAVLGQGPRSLDDVLAAEADAQAVLFGSADFEEGWRAFLAKRAPDFQGR